MVPFSETIYPTGNVEDWLLNVEKLMQKSLKRIIQDALEDYDKVNIDVVHGGSILTLPF